MEVPIAHVIFFIGVTVASYLILSAVYPQVVSLANAFVIQKSKIAERIRTVFSIEEVMNTPQGLMVYLKNIGYESMKADANSYDVFIDGVLFNVTNAVLERDENNNGVFDPGDVLRLTVNVTLVPGEVHRIKVVYSNGASDETIFTS